MARKATIEERLEKAVKLNTTAAPRSTADRRLKDAQAIILDVLADLANEVTGDGEEVLEVPDGRTS